MKKLAFVTAAAAVVAAAALQPANAEEYPWCAQYGFRGGARNCGFVSYQQCLATVSGIGGFCERNSFYRAPARRHYRRQNER